MIQATIWWISKDYAEWKPGSKVDIVYDSIMNILKKANHSDEDQIGGCQGLWGRERKHYKGIACWSFLDGGTVVYPDYGGRYMNLYMCWNLQNCIHTHKKNR